MYLARVNSLDHAPTESSGRVTDFQKCGLCLDRFSLYIYNTMDLVFGCGLLAFGVFMYSKLGSNAFTHVDVAWLGWLSLVIGSLYLISSAMGLCGVSSKGYRWCMTPSSYMALLLAGLSMLLCILVFAMKPTILKYVNENGPELGMSGNQISLFKAWYTIMGWCVLGFFVLELLRYRASLHFKKNVYRQDGEFEALLDHEERVATERMEDASDTRSKKYSDLRKHYKDKYSGNATATADWGAAGAGEGDDRGSSTGSRDSKY